MRFRRSQTSRPMPKHSSVIWIGQRHKDGTIVPVLHMSMAYLVEERAKHPGETGKTDFIAAISDGYLHIYPAPSVSVEIRVRYTPPIEEC